MLVCSDFYFVRHGESANNVLWAHTYNTVPQEADPAQYRANRAAFEQARSPNPDLTAAGHEQAARVAARVAEDFYGKGSEGGVDGEGPRGVDEIWSSYLSRAVDTAVAIQQACQSAAVSSASERLSVPPVCLVADATEVGGHYQYSAEAKGMIGTEGYTNGDVRRRWPDAAFAAMPDENEDHGWCKRTTRETKAEAMERAARLVGKMEAHAHASAALGRRRHVVVITHGDFFRVLLECLSAAHYCTNVPRACCDTIIDAHATNGKIQNTSVSHFRVIPAAVCLASAAQDAASDVTHVNAAATATPPNTSSSKDGEMPCGRRLEVRFEWSSEFIGDIRHLDGVKVLSRE